MLQYPVLECVAVGEGYKLQVGVVGKHLEGAQVIAGQAKSQLKLGLKLQQPAARTHSTFYSTQAAYVIGAAAMVLC